MAATKKIEFLNRTQGVLGAVKVNRKGEEVGIPVQPGTRVFLTDEEIEATEQAHARAEDSPFRVREIVHFDPSTGDEIERFTAAPLERVPVRRNSARSPKAAAAA